MHDGTTNDETADAAASFWRRLLHRWFVEYNPLYLVSAMLVLGGTILSSRGLADNGSVYGGIGVAAIAEVYSVALIAGAALLMRIGQRRSAVMLALLTALYQCDLTLHTETCPNLGWVGVLAAGGWFALSVGKLLALAKAMKLRLSRAAVATATLGALGLAILPYCLQNMDTRGGSALVAVWLFALSAIYRSDAVASEVDLDRWGQTVLHRAVRATWLLWALLLSLHVLFWSSQYKIDLAAVAPIVPVVLTRWIRTEARVWCVVVTTLVFVGLKLPGSFSMSALVVAAALCLRASTAARSAELAALGRSRASMGPPYRAFGASDPGPPPALEPLVVPDDRAAMLRLLIGAGFAVYLSAWTIGWSGGPWPAHVVMLDLLLTAAVVLGAWRMRARTAVVPLVATWIHFVVQARLIPPPRSALEWGGAAIGLGFALLIASLSTSYAVRARAPRIPRVSD